MYRLKNQNILIISNEPWGGGIFGTPNIIGHLNYQKRIMYSLLILLPNGH